jgi:hypothetical protein
MTNASESEEGSQRKMTRYTVHWLGHVAHARRTDDDVGKEAQRLDATIPDIACLED